MSLAKSVYAEAFWDSLRESPVLRFQLIELVEAKSLRELGEQWGFGEHPESVRRYIRGPLRRRLEQEAGGDALRFLMLLMGEKGI